MSKFEQVVTIRRESVKEFLTDGFTVIDGNTEEVKAEMFNKVFKPEEIVIGSRHWLEQDENFLQIIPSIVFRKPDGTVLHYQRTQGTGEGRLLGNYSCNIGGHINVNDLDTSIDRISPILTVWNSIFREVAEELGVALDLVANVNYDEDYNEFRGIIYDSSNSVGKVHIGLLFVFDVAQDCEFNSGIAESEGMLLKGWYSPATLLHHHDIDAINLENWAKIVLEYLA
jgi:predicted NUDIX family phosphoesterase